MPCDVRKVWQTHDGQICDKQGVPTVPGIFFGVVMLPLLDPYTVSALSVWRERIRHAAKSGKEIAWSSSPLGAIRP